MSEGKPTKVRRGERACEVCGKRHWSYDLHRKAENGAPHALSWADPDDGHPYSPKSWKATYHELRAGVREALNPESEGSE
jgi:hypothetical protein